MSKVSAEMPTKAQQNDIGTLSTNPAAGGFATGGGAVRITPAGVEGAAPLNRTVAFIGVSGVGAIRAVSFRGAAEALRFSTGADPGFTGEANGAGRGGKGAGGLGAAGGGGRGV